MASVKKKRAKGKRRPRVSNASASPAVLEPPPVVVDASAAYVRLPVSPEVVAAAREHADNAARLYAMVKSGGAVQVSELLELVTSSARAVERDVRKIRGR